jgi:predicted nucleic acid-binding protein
MSDRVFLDTNVFIYAVEDSADPKSAIADGLISSGLGLQNAVVSYQVVQEFLNVALAKIAKPIRGLPWKSAHGATLPDHTLIEKPGHFCPGFPSRCIDS